MLKRCAKVNDYVAIFSNYMINGEFDGIASQNLHFMQIILFEENKKIPVLAEAIPLSSEL